MENMTQEASQILDEVKVAAYEIKVAAEMGVAVTESDILASYGQWLHITADDIKYRRYLEILRQHGARDLPLTSYIDTDEYFIDLESGLKTEEVVCKCCWFEKCPKCDGYGRPANNRIERIVKELKDNDTALKFFPAEMVKELTGNGYAFEFIPVESVKVLKDVDRALKFIRVEMVKKYAFFIPDEMAKKLKEDGYALLIPVETAKKLKEDGYAFFIPDEMAKKLKEDGYALFIPDEMAKKLKEDGYAFFIPDEMAKKLKEDGYALFIPDEIAKKLKEDGYALFIPDEIAKKLKEDGYALFIPVEMAKKLNDAMIEEVVNKSLGKRFAEWFGYANDYIEKTVKPEMGILFSGATMQNIYQLATSGMMTTGKGKTLMKLNEAAFMMLLYGHIMPRRAAGHIALAIGVALASAAYLVTMSFAF